MATENKRKNGPGNSAGSKPAGPSTKGIEVVSKRENFFRAGIQFGHEHKRIALDTLTQDQLDEIRNERMLIVRDIDIDPAQEGAEQEG